MHRVSGTVLFEGKPVEEGRISFEDRTKGLGGTSEIGPGGAYQASLPEGTYTVTVEPPLVEFVNGTDTEPDLVYKEMPNIPQKYRRAQSSDLSITVKEDNSEQNIELKP